mmetsp:Transcript_11514/g.15999  ORF Transcript_11514/g.15999 Transcript_11514/m.15999 type:complete len:88 (+) Transcript_11514:119-382(+)
MSQAKVKKRTYRHTNGSITDRQRPQQQNRPNHGTPTSIKSHEGATKVGKDNISLYNDRQTKISPVPAKISYRYRQKTEPLFLCAGAT